MSVLSHTSGISTSFSSLMYQIGTGSQFNYGAFVLNQVTQHVGSQAVQMPIYFPRLICRILLAQKSDILLSNESPSLVSSPLSSSYKLYQGKHVADLVHAESEDTKSVPHQVFMNSLFGRRVMHILVNESEDLGLLIQHSIEMKTEV